MKTSEASGPVHSRRSEAVLLDLVGSDRNQERRHRSGDQPAGLSCVAAAEAANQLAEQSSRLQPVEAQALLESVGRSVGPLDQLSLAAEIRQSTGARPGGNLRAQPPPRSEERIR